jgi:FkbM family methyltransferase
MKWRAVIQDLLRRKGYELTRYPLPSFFSRHEFDVVLDVGANIGQYASEIRRSGYSRSIVSFEPLNGAFAALSRSASNDPHWVVQNYALGKDDSEQPINVSGNLASSSLRSMLPLHVAAAPEAAVIGTESIKVKRLDGVFNHFCNSGDRVLLKIDTQGFERDVLEGATNSILDISALQIELSLVALYHGEALIEEIVGFVRDLGFVPFWFTHGLKDPATQQLLQIDGLFIRE